MMRRPHDTHAKPAPVVRLTRVGFPEAGIRLSVANHPTADRIFDIGDEEQASAAAHEVAAEIGGRIVGLPL